MGLGIVGLVRSAADYWLQKPAMTRAALVSYLCDLVGPGLSGAFPQHDDVAAS